MISKETSALISIAKNGIILNSKSKRAEKVLFDDVAKIHISIQQRQVILKSFLILYFLFTLICLPYLNIELSIFSIVIFVINFMVMNTLDFKTYRLQIVLKNNVIIEKHIPKKLKYEYITIINEVRNQLQQNPTPAL
jgi:hypothetical protein